jgi:hypothetical protein
MMKIHISKITDIEAARRALAATVGKEFQSKATLRQVYLWKHSPIRTQIFEITLTDIYSFVSVHLARHVTIQPFVTSKRTDRGGDGKEDRMTPVDMVIWANAEAVMNMAAKRLCYQASKETREVVDSIRELMKLVDPDLAEHMVPACVTQGGYCREPKPCGNYRVKRYDPQVILKELEIW